MMRIGHAYVIFCCMAIMALASCSGNSKSDTQGDSADMEDIHSETHKTSDKYLTTVFLPDQQMVFRNVMLDMSLESVKASEEDSELTLAGETENFLHYEQDLNADTVKGLDYVEIKYIFDDLDRLDIITINYYIQDSLVTNDLYDHLNVAFNEQYGDYYIDSDGYTVWESSYKRADTLDVVFDIGIRKLVKLNDPGITIEMMRFGTL